MKFTGRTYHVPFPAVRDLAYMLQREVERLSFPTASKLQNYIIDQLAADGWPADARVERQGKVIAVICGAAIVLEFKETTPR